MTSSSLIGEPELHDDRVLTPRDSLLDERYWVKPNGFIPERWTTKSELVKDGSVYAPFGHGEYYRSLPPSLFLLYANRAWITFQVATRASANNSP